MVFQKEKPSQVVGACYNRTTGRLMTPSVAPSVTTGWRLNFKLLKNSILCDVYSPIQIRRLLSPVAIGNCSLLLAAPQSGNVLVLF